MRSPFKFARHGQCGVWVSEAMPHLAGSRRRYRLHPLHVHDQPDPRAGHLPDPVGQDGTGPAALGSWVVYGLGSENQNLPAYVVLDDPLGLPVNGVENWQAGFLPPTFQGTRFRSTGSPVLNLRPDSGRPAEVVRAERKLLVASIICTSSNGPRQPTSTRASPATNWPHACNWRRPMPSIYPVKARRPGTHVRRGP